MSGETVITVVGNLTDDPELRFTPAGAAVAKFSVASTPRVYDKTAGEWRDGEALFLPCTVWRDYAEHVAESLTRGMRVMVQGRLAQRSYETREGIKRTVFELEVEEVGPVLRYATATVVKAPASSDSRAVREARAGQGRASVADPWQASTPGTHTGGQGAGGGHGWGSGGEAEEPPF
ncbi:single-stranded DNA-binding protein [Streptomyces xanthochromogenes]|uniref:single-stranded DNA-binding protein n=1 Tax=Streptomyces xanthochromogenes TaxID=67384 RepID=UPI0034214D7B